MRLVRPADVCTFAEFRRNYPRAAFFDVQLGVGSFSDGTPAHRELCRRRPPPFERADVLDTNFDPPLVPPTPVAPATAADEYATPQNTPLVVGAPSGVLLNDSAQAATR